MESAWQAHPAATCLRLLLSLARLTPCASIHDLAQISNETPMLIYTMEAGPQLPCLCAQDDQDHALLRSPAPLDHRR